MSNNRTTRFILHGGKTARLMEALTKYPNIVELLSGRTVAADSAGAHVLGTFYYSKNSKTIGKGLGVLPLKISAHYEKGTPDPFAGFVSQLGTVLLGEYETKVIE